MNSSRKVYEKVRIVTWWFMKTKTVDDITWRLAYRDGIRAPRYPVPAIIQHFEFGWSLTDSEPVLMHIVRGPYSD